MYSSPVQSAVFNAEQTAVTGTLITGTVSVQASHRRTSLPLSTRQVATELLTAHSLCIIGEPFMSDAYPETLTMYTESELNFNIALFEKCKCLITEQTNDLYNLNNYSFYIDSPESTMYIGKTDYQLILSFWHVRKRVNANNGRCKCICRRNVSICIKNVM